ncbi:MAG TPA: hypothetical protein VEB42_15310, partial [Chitinophagaceae bacterium]|nr:hypothetical protein [Chitinophagaceae bacterium]
AVKAVNINGKGAISISSAPAQMVRVRPDEPMNFPVKITVTDMNGRLVQQVNYETPVLFMDFRMKASNNGRFVVHVVDAAGTEKSGIVVL